MLRLAWYGLDLNWNEMQPEHDIQQFHFIHSFIFTELMIILHCCIVDALQQQPHLVQTIRKWSEHFIKSFLRNLCRCKSICAYTRTNDSIPRKAVFSFILSISHTFHRYHYLYLTLFIIIVIAHRFILSAAFCHYFRFIRWLVSFSSELYIFERIDIESKHYFVIKLIVGLSLI